MNEKQITILVSSVVCVALGLLVTTTEGTLALVVGFSAMWVGATCAFGVLESLGDGESRGR